MATRLLTLTVFTALLCSGITAQAETLYRWVDENGRVTYQGQPPLDQQFAEEQVKSTSGPARAAPQQQVEITFYAVKTCEACDLARQDLIARGLKFTELNPETDLPTGKAMIERFGKVEVPLVLVGEALVRGYNPIWLTAELEKAGVTAPPAEPPTEPTTP